MVMAGIVRSGMMRLVLILVKIGGFRVDNGRKVGMVNLVSHPGLMSIHLSEVRDVGVATV